MFCPFCGATVADGAAFCSTCGKSLSAQPSVAVQAPPITDYQAQKNAVRQSEINALDNGLRYFMQKKDDFDAYDMVCELVNYYAGGAKSSLLVWGCIIATFGIIGLLAAASGGGAALLGMFLAFLLPGGMMIAGGILMKINNRKKYAYYQQEYANLSQSLYEHYLGYPNCPVGPEYVNPEILSLVMGILQSGRADTIKESLNILESSVKQSEIDAYLEMIESNTAAINAQTRVAAVFAAANFFK